MSKTYASNYGKDTRVSGVVKGAVVPQSGKVVGRDVRRQREKDQRERQAFADKPYTQSAEDFSAIELAGQTRRLQEQIKNYNSREFTYAAKHALDLAKQEDLEATLIRESKQRRSRFRMMLASSLIHNQSLGDGLASAAGLAIGFLIGGGLKKYTGKDGLTSKQRNAVRLQKFTDKVESNLRDAEGVVDGAGLRSPNYFVDNVLIRAKEGAFAKANMHVPMSTESVAIAGLGIYVTTLDKAMEPGADVNRIRREGAEAIESLYNIAAKDGMDQGAVHNAMSRMSRSLESFDVGGVTDVGLHAMETAFNDLVYHSQSLADVQDTLVKGRIEQPADNKPVEKVLSASETLLDKLNQYAGIDISGKGVTDSVMVHGNMLSGNNYVHSDALLDSETLHTYIDGLLLATSSDPQIMSSEDANRLGSLKDSFDGVVSIINEARDSGVSDTDIRLAVMTHVSDVYAETVGSAIYETPTDALDSVFDSLGKYVKAHEGDDVALRQVGAMLKEVITEGEAVSFKLPAKGKVEDIVTGMQVPPDPELCRIATKLRLNAEMAIARDISEAPDKDDVQFKHFNVFGVSLLAKTRQLVEILADKHVPGYGHGEKGYGQQLEILTDSVYIDTIKNMASYRSGIISLDEFNDSVEPSIPVILSCDLSDGSHVSLLDHDADSGIHLETTGVFPILMLCDNELMMDFAKSGTYSHTEPASPLKSASVADLVPGFESIMAHLEEEKKQKSVSLLPDFG